MVTGLQRTGRIMTAAAGVLAVTFIAFATSGVTFIKLMGLGLALAILLDAVGWIRITDAEQASLEWLSGFEAATVQNIAAVIRRARAS